MAKNINVFRQRDHPDAQIVGTGTARSFETRNAVPRETWKLSGGGGFWESMSHLE